MGRSNSIGYTYTQFQQLFLLLITDVDGMAVSATAKGSSEPHHSVALGLYALVGSSSAVELSNLVHSHAEGGKERGSLTA